MRGQRLPSTRPSAACAVIAFLVGAAPPGMAQAQPRLETLERAGGQHIPGRLTSDARTGLAFQPASGGAPLALEPGATVQFQGPGPNPLASPPPFRVLVGEAMRL